MARKIKWGIGEEKTKPTQGASVNTPRHCSETPAKFARIASTRQVAGENVLFREASHRTTRKDVLSDENQVLPTGHTHSQWQPNLTPTV
jgi:hypothetical protein